MIGIVVVSHSAALAQSICELAGQMAQGKVRLVAAGGSGDPEHPLGTNTFRVLEALEEAYSDDGVLVLMDLGSAILSAESALEFWDAERRGRVRLCAAPLVEGAVAAAAVAAAGAGLEEAAREADRALTGKSTHLSAPAAEQPRPPSVSPVSEGSATLPNPLGLHARPAAALVRIARKFPAGVTLYNQTTGAGPAPAASISALLSLGARGGHRVRVCADGAEAAQAVAAVVEFLNGGCGEASPPRDTAAPAAVAPAVAATAPAGAMSGIPASAGIGIGPLVHLRRSSPEIGSEPVRSVEEEEAKLRAALAAAAGETRILSAGIQSRGDAAGIFEAQEAVLEDPELIGEVVRTIRAGEGSAAFGWHRATAALAVRVRALDDPYLRERAADVEDVANRVLEKLTGRAGTPLRLTQPSVVAARNLIPADVPALNRDLVMGVVLEMGSANAHSAILARAMELPLVVGLGPALTAIPEGTIVAVDGAQGAVWVSPGEERLAALRDLQESWKERRAAAQSARSRPAITRDGEAMRVFANISGIADAAEAVALGAEGVGVLRTEFLFFGRSEPPGEEEQMATYSAIGAALDGRPLVVRTLDIGGDKPIPYAPIAAEANPFLGWRGIRVTLDRRDLMRTQLRAILRAGHELRMDVLLPMITTLQELREAKALIREASSELELEGLPFRRGVVPGVMIETPAAAVIADHLAREAAFFSIGSNDLIQYVMVADRTNPKVAALADPFAPPVLRVIRQTVDAAREAGIEATLCGELAADPLATPLLMGMGLREFSVSAPLIPDLKTAIRGWRLADAAALAQKALLQESAAAVRALLSASA